METSNPLLKRAIDLSQDRELTETMTLEGTVNKTGILMLLCLGSASFAWTQPDLAGVFMLLGLIGGFIACMIGTFMPRTAAISAPAYAVLEGLCLGALSYMFNARWPGIMANALVLTFGVLGVMLTLYITRIVRVTSKMMMGIFMATAAVALTYVVDMVLGIFHISVPYLHDSGPIGIGISLVIVAIASFNLLVDFAVVESNILRRAPKYMEWYCGMAMLVTLVWLYLEILRLLSKMRNR